MAIFKGLKGVAVSIMFDGKKSTEFEAPLDETQHEYPKRTVLRYIEASSNTNYSIINEISSMYKLKSSLEFIVQVDGWKLPIPPLLIRSENSSAWTNTVDGKEDVDHKGSQWKKPFKFASLNIVDTHDRARVKKDANSAKHIGEIKVTVRRRQAKDEIPYEGQGKDDKTNLEIAEKAVKGQALSHGTKLGKAVWSKERTKIYETRNQRGTREPAAVFIFRYRSRDALEAEHIIPRTRGQTPDILHGMSDEKIRRMARERMSGIEDNKMKIKKEPRGNGGDSVKFTNDDETLTIDITGDEEVEIWEPKAPKERVDLCDD